MVRSGGVSCADSGSTSRISDMQVAGGVDVVRSIFVAWAKKSRAGVC
jgi:hypothetical protein